MKYLALALVVVVGTIVFVQGNATNQTSGNYTANATTEVRKGGDSCSSFRNDERTLVGTGCTNSIDIYNEEEGADKNNGNKDLGTPTEKKSCRDGGLKCSSSQTGNGEFGNILKNRGSEDP
jgi:hypothetical protein